MDNIEGIGATIHQMHMVAKRESMRDAELTKLRAEIAELRKQRTELIEYLDWIVWDDSYERECSSALRTCLWVLRGIYEVPGGDFDAAIDTAMKEEK